MLRRTTHSPIIGRRISQSSSREYDLARLRILDHSDALLGNLPQDSQVWLSLSDNILRLPENFRIIASTDKVEVAGYKVEDEPTWGIQFRPDSSHTEQGMQILDNFLTICGCQKDWTPESFIETTIKQLKEQLGDDKVILALSGGVDSSVTAVLLNKAIGKNLTCIFVDHGLLRKNEFEKVLADYQDMGLNVIGVDAKERFYKALKGVTDPEKKRKIIGKGFIEIFEEEARKLKNIKWLAQGTIYPDIIESLSVTGTTIKSHHNVGGLPEKMNLKLCEPLRILFKDEVRRIGLALGMKPQLIYRHPFPGPGLGIRILGEITPEKVRIVQDADDIFISALHAADLYDKVWQPVLFCCRYNRSGNGRRTYIREYHCFACRDFH